MFRRAPVVELSDEGVRRRTGRGETEEVRWTELIAVEVVTTDDGPAAEDVFFVLHGSAGGCVVPQGQMPEGLLERLQALPGFDNEVLIEAMASVDHATFTCWTGRS